VVDKSIIGTAAAARERRRANVVFEMAGNASWAVPIEAVDVFGKVN
jgi:hypothetical protein